jgi:uncharacterized Zn-binding protein involved in type VI secretion
MGKPAAAQGDKIVATDTHILMVPSPGGPVPTPTPMPFSGTLTSGLSTDVFIEGKPAATVDSIAFNQPIHVPAAGPFQKPPTNQGKILVGSTGVFINGKPAARQGDIAITCNDPVDAPLGQVVAARKVFIGETGAGIPKSATQQASTPKILQTRVAQPGAITKVQWEKNKAEYGEQIKILTEVKDFQDGTPAKIKVWEKINGEDVFVTEIDAKVKGKKIETTWKQEE